MPQPKSVAKFDSKGTPNHELKFSLDLPEEEIICGLGALSFISLHGKDMTSQIFEPKGETTLKVTYNMYTKALQKVESLDEKIEIIKSH